MVPEGLKRSRARREAIKALREEAKARPEPTPEDIARQERGREAAIRNHGFNSQSQRRTSQRLEAAVAEGQEIEREVEERRSLAELLRTSFDALPNMNPDRIRSPQDLEHMEDQHRLGDEQPTDDIRRWGPKSKRKYFAANERTDYRPLRAGARQKRGPWRGPHRRIELASLGATASDVEKRLGKGVELDGRRVWPQEDGSVVVFDSYGLGQEPRPIVIAPYGIHTFYTTDGSERMLWHAAQRRFMPSSDFSPSDLAHLRGLKERPARLVDAPPARASEPERDALHEAIQSFKLRSAVLPSESVIAEAESAQSAPRSVVDQPGEAVVPDPGAERDEARERRRERRDGKRSRHNDLDGDE